ncbi:MAG: histone family protein [Candidatus Methanoliparum thermophilum]|uniref:Histone family protein n=1 Tax=Methanoliparum thermophilum TaxID=2491083 RepID=A0A520KRE4_METT2|nr:histone family protein [Candidatus Methanoliparum sp. LAM-1]RZN64201.1 MAG: histone family protein [Candidatus Methanoliparum thermophilum]BDC36657.1 histone [Candidatus Methanoliparum sp. LAM-1]
MVELPIAPIERIAKKSGAERISEDAKVELAKILEDYGSKIASEAVKLAKHAGRKTIKTEDIKLAREKV